MLRHSYAAYNYIGLYNIIKNWDPNFVTPDMFIRNIIKFIKIKMSFS